MQKQLTVAFVNAIMGSRFENVNTKPDPGQKPRVNRFYVSRKFIIAPSVNFCNHFLQKGGLKVPEKWTGRLIGRLHNEQITCTELAEEMGVTKPYISMILNGKRKPEGIRERMEAAVTAIIERKKAGA